MISINKGASPTNLAATGQTLTNANIVLYNGDEANYNTGDSTFTFTGDYRTDEVKKALIACQHNKCCFSEAKFTGDYSDVEHFRPKGRVDEYNGNGKLYPGYYWLAYNWENLFLSKTRPNTSQKRNFFPLYNEANRNRNHYDTNVEAPMLIDPGAENPRDYIRFHEDEPIGIDVNGRGKFNIDFFDLRHSEFEEGRRTKLGLLKALKDAVDLLLSAGFAVTEPVVENSLNKLRQAMNPEAEFSSMAIDFLSGWPPLE